MTKPSQHIANSTISVSEHQNDLNEVFFNSVLDNDFESAELFLRNGADVNARHELGMTTLIAAASKGNLEACEYLLKNGADSSIKDDFRRPAFAYACDRDSNISRTFPAAYRKLELKYNSEQQGFSR